MHTYVTDTGWVSGGTPADQRFRDRIAAQRPPHPPDRDLAALYEGTWLPPQVLTPGASDAPRTLAEAKPLVVSPFRAS